MSRKPKPLTPDQMRRLLSQQQRHRGRPAARVRPKPGEMNRTEARYADRLRELVRAGEVREWWWDWGSLKLAPNTHYRPDFLVMLPDGRLEVHEVKGKWEEDALVKTKIAAAMFPWPILVCQWRGREGWSVEPIHEYVPRGEVA